MDSVTRAFGAPNAEANPNRHALRQTDDAEEAIAENSEGSVRYGYYTVTVIVMEESVEIADESAKIISNSLSERGFPARIETVNSLEAYLGSLPGHGHENIRRPLIHTLALADLMPTTAVWPGLEYHPSPLYPPKSPPLLIVSAADTTPNRLSLHVGSNGHTLIAGPVDAGKSTLLNLLMASHFRYPDAEVIGFDYKNSAFALCEASGGTYYDLLTPSEHVAEETPFLAPLLHVDNEGELSWAKEWIEDILTLHSLTPTPKQKKEIRRALEKVAASDPDMRSLSAFCTNVQDHEIKEALAYYQEGILDAETDNIHESRYTLFEMRHLMDHGPQLVIPTLLYMFRRITQRLKGQPVMIPMDEAWFVLAHQLFAEKLAVWLRTIRSMNGHVVLATQSLSELAESSISHILRETCATKILLPNTHATDSRSIQLYRDLNLSDEQIENLTMLDKKRHYFYLSDLGERVLDLTLGPVTLAFVGATSMQDVTEVKALKAEYGGGWPIIWLKRKGLDRAAAEWEAA
jgi:type IV secretion system protein VirB4